jgi:hypothetical protein
VHPADLGAQIASYPSNEDIALFREDAAIKRGKASPPKKMAGDF